MCLLIAIRGQDGSLLLAANRDEWYDRPSSAPAVWEGCPALLAGRDLRAGGTWLAVNACGVVSAVTNRPTPGGQQPHRPTRGRLPLLASGQLSAARARLVLSYHLRYCAYNGFNLFVADADSAFIIQAAGAVDIRDVPSGAYVLGNGGWDDPADPRVARAHHLLHQAGAACLSCPEEGPLSGAVECLTTALAGICRDHEPIAGAGSLCLHAGDAGTVSSTILLLDGARRLRHYLHVSTSPCQGQYREMAGLLPPRPELVMAYSR
jgi:uncharacterized protein with NRDE domain